LLKDIATVFITGNIVDKPMIPRMKYIMLPERNKNPFIEKFKEIIISNLGNCNFEVEKAMENIPLSKDYLRVLFKKDTGMSPHDYLTEKRINFAENLFRHTYSDDITIKFIAVQVGFDDPYYFSRIFKKHTGMNPTQWINANCK
jgi:AraC family transcriptional regulator, arabinose operon regulatory protein